MKCDQRSDDVVASQTSLRVIEIDPQSDSRWETLMKSQPASVVYQHPAWLRVLEEVYGYKPMHLACEDSDGQLCGLLPLFSRRGLRTGRMCESLFDSPTAGPLARSSEISALLIQRALERTRNEGGSRFQMKVPSVDFDQLVDEVYGVPVYETYELTLPEQPDGLHIDSRIKWSINKATRLGVQVRPAETEEELRVWYDLYLQTMRHLVAVPKPYRFFQVAWQYLQPRGLMQLLLAEHVEAGKSRIISGFLFLQWSHTISHIFTGWRREDQTLRPNDLLHWHAIRNASAQGLRWYDFGNVRVGDQGLIHFKSKWGAQAKNIYRYSYPTVASAAPSPRPVSAAPATPVAGGSGKSSAIRQRISPLWQHLPLKTIEWVGNGCHTLRYY